MSELKSCPFCGGEAERKQIKPYRKIKGRGQSYQATVGCTKWDCGADVSRAGFDIETSWQYAEDFWNRRAAGWISVEERLPESEIEALVYSPSCKKIFMAFYHKEIWMFTHDHCPIYEQISYWMPLPGLPEGVKRDE